MLKYLYFLVINLLINLVQLTKKPHKFEKRWLLPSWEFIGGYLYDAIKYQLTGNVYDAFRTGVL